MTWRSFYGSTSTCTENLERAFIVDTPLVDHASAETVACFASATPTSLRRVGRHALRRLAGRDDLVKVLTALEELDALVSRLNATYRARVAVHAHLYGPNEMAHAPVLFPVPEADRSASAYVSFNLGHARLRRLLAGVTRGDVVATAVLVDLYLHEKAHLVECRAQAADAPTVHDEDFYRVKWTLKVRLLKALEANPRCDPFRRTRYDGALASVEDVARRAPHLVVGTGIKVPVSELEP